MNTTSVEGLNARLQAWFPDREFFMRSNGQVRFIKISSRLQKLAAAGVAALLLVWLLSMAGMAVSHYLSASERADLLNREARVTKAESRVDSYRNDLKGVQEDLQRRQDFIEKMVGILPTDAKAGETVSDSSSESAKAVNKIGAVIPEAAALARIEARQLAFVEGLTRMADRRAAAAAERIRKLALDPQAMLASLDDKSAMGGPLLRMATGRDGSIDPRFERLGLSLARMNGLERTLAGVPQVLPAALEFMSSNFGYRADPFTGEGAFHAGLDFRGPIGAPIYAAAKGTVSFAGVRSGYGNCVEVDHGNGLMTRYAHMSAIKAQVGQAVPAGTVIGLIGNTGRSTGPHLHFEVRLHDRAVNPRPFLEAASHVLQDSPAK